MTGDAPLTLSDVCLLVEDCLHATAPTATRGYPLIRTPNIGKGRLLLDDAFRVSEQTYEIWTRRVTPQNSDLVLAREAPAGNVAIIKGDTRVCLGQRTVLLRPNPEAVDPDFLCYFLLAPRQQSMLLSTATGATAQHVNMVDIRRLSLHNLPPLTMQSRIGSILSAYDDLIENNRRRIQLLEQAARLIYQEWFVRLRFPGHERVRVVDGVPEGWERRSLGDLCRSFEDGDWVESKDQGGEDYRLLQVSNVGINQFIETGNFRYISEETFRHLKCRQVLPGDILISRMPRPVGRAWLVTPMPWRMITAVDVAIAGVDVEQVSPLLVLYYLNSPFNFQQCETHITGATRPRVTRSILRSLVLLVPSRKLQRIFDQQVEPIQNQMVKLRQMNDRLRQARDLLLPRLMSGEIVV